MARPTTEEFVAGLTDAEVKDVFETLQKRYKQDARREARTYAALLITNLKIADRYDLASDIEEAIKAL